METIDADESLRNAVHAFSARYMAAQLLAGMADLADAECCRRLLMAHGHSETSATALLPRAIDHARSIVDRPEIKA